MQPVGRDQDMVIKDRIWNQAPKCFNHWHNEILWKRLCTFPAIQCWPHSFGSLPQFPHLSNGNESNRVRVNTEWLACTPISVGAVAQQCVTIRDLWLLTEVQTLPKYWQTQALQCIVLWSDFFFVSLLKRETAKWISGLVLGFWCCAWLFEAELVYPSLPCRNILGG